MKATESPRTRNLNTQLSHLLTVNPKQPQMICTSVWKCRGLWYSNTWGLDGAQVLEISGQHKGFRTEAKARFVAASDAALIKRKYVQAENFPVVNEHSPEWKAILGQV